ncbi:MAG: resolvase [Desulfobacteraceae bacterium]|nr:MAG: resolvase [Desulfobacteraceae bacterium]
MKLKARGYIRVSTDKQDTENQRHEILKMANEERVTGIEFTEETVSGRKSWKDRKLHGLIEELGSEDILIVAELSRLGRSMLEIMEILSIATQKRVKVYAVKGGWKLDGSMQAKIMAMVLAMAAEIERDLISQRTKAALATKREQGVKLGRPRGPGKSKLDSHREEILELLTLGLARKRVAKKFGTNPANLYKWLRQRNIKIEERTE